MSKFSSIVYLTIFLNYLLINNCIKQVLCKRTSGLYTDDGYQTIIHSVTKHEKREIQKEILEFLGLPEKPIIKDDVEPLKNSASEFLIDIYNSALNENNNNEINNFISKIDYQNNINYKLSKFDSRLTNESDVIISIPAQYRAFPTTKNRQRKKLWFDTTEAPNASSIIGAELRIYRSIKKRPKEYHKTIKILAHQIVRTNGRKKLVLINSAFKKINERGWMTLNISKALQNWVNNPKDNKGLYLSVRTIDRFDRELKQEDAGIVGISSDADKQPFMVGFFKTSDSSSRKTHKKREVKRHKRSLSTYRDYSDIFYPKKPDVKPSYGEPCQMKSFRVNFTDLAWQNWIIGPPVYEANYCSGECSFPLNSHMNATNHAIVQTLVNLRHPDKAPKVCCVPLQLSSLPIVYYGASTVIFKKYKNMVVKSCGCL